MWWLPDADTARRALVERLDRGDRIRTGDRLDHNHELVDRAPVLVTIGAGDVFKLGESLLEES